MRIRFVTVTLLTFITAYDASERAESTRQGKVPAKPTAQKTAWPVEGLASLPEANALK